MLDWMIAALVLIGAFFTLVGSIGLYKLPDFYMRLHGPTKATTLGVGAILIASMLYFSLTTDAASLHEILVTVFLFITAPVSAHLMAKAALHIKLKQVKRTRNDGIFQQRNNSADGAHINNAFLSKHKITDE